MRDLAAGTVLVDFCGASVEKVVLPQGTVPGAHIGYDATPE